MEINAKDRRILAALLENARLPISALAKRCAVSRDVVRYAMGKCEEAGVIGAYRTHVDQGAFAQGVASVMLKLSGATQQRRAEIIAQLCAHDRTNWVAELSGTFDITCNVFYTSNEDLAHQVGDITDIVGDALKEHRLSLYTTEYKFTRLGLLDKNAPVAERIVHFHGTPQALDETDRRILRILVKDCRAPATDIAESVGTTPETVRQRVKALERSVINSYTILLNPEALGYEGYHVELQLERMNDATTQKMAAWANARPEVAYCTRMVGRHNIVLTIYTRTRQEFNTVLQDLRDTFAQELLDYELQMHLSVHKEVSVPEAMLR